jgi:hypothetical protein
MIIRRLGSTMPVRVVRKRSLVGAAVALAASSLGALAACGSPAQASPGQASPVAAAPGWHVVTVQNYSGIVGGLAATGSGNAWLTESACANKQCTAFTSRQLQWSGSAWRVRSLPAGYAGSLVIPASPASTWLDRTVMIGQYHSRDLLLDWTGKNTGPVKSLAEDIGIGTGVAPTAKDVWFLGSAPTGLNGTGYALQYDNGAWRASAVPFVGQGASASSAANVWVSGYAPADDSAGVMAFNGKKWRSVPLPPLSSSWVYTGDGNIAAVSPTSVWLEIERTSNSDLNDSPPYLLHWTGSKWASIKIPYDLSYLGGAPIAQDGHGGVWLSLADLSKSGSAQFLLLHYLNGKWSRLAVPAPAGYAAAQPVALAWIPGTRSLWGAVPEFNQKMPKSPGKLVILKYGN